MAQRKSKRMALCGVMGSLMVTAMLLGDVIPLATFCAPMLAGILLVPVAQEYGNRVAFVLYLAVGVLSLLVSTDPEMSFCFVFMSGPYPMIRNKLGAIRPRLLGWGIKLVYFSLMLLIMYGLLYLLFPGVLQLGGMGMAGNVELAVLGGLGLLTFLAYDSLLFSFSVAYRIKLRPRLKQFL